MLSYLEGPVESRLRPPPLVSDEDLEVVDLLSDSDGVHGEAKNSRSEGVCRCEEVQRLL